MELVGMSGDEGMMSTDFDLPAVSVEADFSLGTPFPDATSVADSADAGVGVMPSADALAVMGASGVEGLPTGADLFDSAESSVADLEGILQSLPGASHLPPGIVSSGGTLDFGSEISKLPRSPSVGRPLSIPLYPAPVVSAAEDLVADLLRKEPVGGKLYHLRLDRTYKPSIYPPLQGQLRNRSAWTLFGFVPRTT